jgi:hypothetical protein
MGLLITLNGSPHIRYYDTLASGANVSLPGGVTNNAYRPTFGWYQGKVYITGQFSENLIVTISAGVATAYKMGLAKPVGTPFTLAAQGAGITGFCYGKITYVQKIGTDTIIESEGSDQFGGVMLTNQGRRWSGFPAVSPDARITHARGYVSVDGSEFFAAWELASASFFGVANYDEAIATAALGALLPENSGFPTETKTTRFCEVYHDRMWYASSTNNKYRIWFSEVGQPESVGVFSFFDTRDGEQITGMKRLRDQLIIFCRRSTYAVQGFGPQDFVISKISQDIGCVSAHSVVNIYDRLWFAGSDGVYLYDGGFKLLTENLNQFYKDSYASRAVAFENAIAVNDLYRNVYKLLLDQGGSPYHKSWCGHYLNFEPSIGGTRTQPDWSFDIRARQDNTHANYYSNTAGEQIITGSTDGHVRFENVYSNSDDDGDSYGKSLTIVTPHYFMGEPGGDAEEGKTFSRIWTYVECDGSAWILRLLGGDEAAGGQLITSPAVWTDNVPASILTRVIGGSTYYYLPKSVHVHVPDKLSGRGLTLMIVAASPVGFVYRGFGGIWGPGPITRGYTHTTTP